jgi:uncharacterized protein (TIGR00288 family)
MAVFIDADNLNDPTALDHVLVSIRSFADRVLYRRAYGRPESLKAIEAVLWKHGVRPVANLIVDKVTTDSALVIDAVEAVCTNDIDAVAICSGDADFVPLAIWLRERGKRVFCYSLANKIFANPESFYDEVVLLDVVDKALFESSGAGEVPAPVAQIATQHPQRAPKAPDPTQPAKPARVTGPSAPQSVESGSKRATIKQILTVLPELKSKDAMHLSQATKRLRDANVLGKKKSSPSLFGAYPAQFELLPLQQPNSVRFRG